MQAGSCTRDSVPATGYLTSCIFDRLRFSFVDVKPKADQKSDAPVKTGKSPILASVFSDIFQVYSAKKFPGVCDSTELSKCFATQGIKIPIRKEGGKGAADDDDDDD